MRLSKAGTELDYGGVNRASIRPPIMQTGYRSA
jgi:hypothetical protein